MFNIAHVKPFDCIYWKDSSNLCSIVCFFFTFLFIEQTAHVLKHYHISCPTKRNSTHSKETSAFFLLVPKPPQYIRLHGCDIALAHAHCMSVVYSFDSIMFVPQTNWFFRIWFYRWKRECVHMFHWCKHYATKWPLLVSLLLLPSFSPITRTMETNRHVFTLVN